MEADTALTVIGAGHGRTGTLSLKAALEGLGPCYHMTELLAHPEGVGYLISPNKRRSVRQTEMSHGPELSMGWAVGNGRVSFGAGLG